MAITVFLLWTNCFDWLRLFDSTAKYMRLITETMSDLVSFLFYLIVGMMASGFPLHFLNQRRIIDRKFGGDYDPIYERRFGIDFIDAMFTQYLNLFGAFEIDLQYRKYENRDVFLVYLVFLFCTFFTQVIIMNMLIAIMADTFARVDERKIQVGLKEKLQAIHDYYHILKVDEKVRFLAVLRPDSDENQDQWLGMLTTIKRKLNQAVQQLKDYYATKQKALEKNIAISTQDIKKNMN